MRFQYISDIHLEKRRFHPTSATAPFLFVAGDLGHPRCSEFGNLLGDMCRNWKQVFYVPGNHEYDGANCEISMAAIDRDIDRMASNYENLHVLRSGRIFKLGKFDVAGCTLWSFSRGRNWRFMEEAQFLEDTIKKSARPLIIMTHYLPTHFFHRSTGICSNLDFLLRPPVKLWIGGHMHISRKVKIHNVQFLINAGTGKIREFEI